MRFEVLPKRATTRFSMTAVLSAEGILCFVVFHQNPVNFPDQYMGSAKLPKI